MKLQFDPNQSFQLDAMAAVTELFEGQPQGAPEYAVINAGDMGGLFAGQDRTELGVGNRLLLAEEKLLANCRAIQTCNDIEVADAASPLEAWELFDAPANLARRCPHFSVEMETGTGKTRAFKVRKSDGRVSEAEGWSSPERHRVYTGDGEGVEGSMTSLHGSRRQG